MGHIETYQAFQDELRVVRAKYAIFEGDMCSECPGEDEIIVRMDAFWWTLSEEQRNEIEALPNDRSYPDWKGP